MDDLSSESGETAPTDVDGTAGEPASLGVALAAVAGAAVPERAPAIPARPLIGRVLGRFRVVEPLGAGGLGEVYRAEQEMLGRDAVIKVMRRDRAVTSARAERFLREARMAARLDHPYAAHVYAFGAEPDGLLWIAMELVRGQTLRALVHQRGPMPPALFAPLAVALCEVVHAAHELGIVHRDLKPANVMVVASGGHFLPKLIDFGVAKSVDASDLAPERAPGDPVGGHLTRDDQMLGSPHYMAPEQLAAPAAVDRRADVYALGALCYYVLSGRPPFAGNSAGEVAHARMEGGPAPLRVDPAGAIDAVLAHALARDPAHRPATALELGDALSAAAAATAAPPALDPALVETWTARAPEPLAELVFALSGARTPSEADGVARTLVEALARWLAVLALAGQRHHQESPPERARQLGRHLLDRGLSSAEWLELADELSAAAARPRTITGTGSVSESRADSRDQRRAEQRAGSRPGSSPAGRAVGRADDDDQATAPLAAFFAGPGAAALAALAAPRESLPPGPALHARLSDDLARLRAVLCELGAMLDIGLVADVAGQPLALSGLGRRRPAAMWGPPLAPGETALVTAGGAHRLTLSPLVALAPAVPGADPVVFVLAGGPRGPCLRALPSGAEIAGGDAAREVAEALDLTAADADRGATDEDAPYRGLAPFGAGDASRFVGRAREAESFINLLRARRVVGLVGASGAGKSSFLHAGVLAALPEGWTGVSLRPGASPLRSLVAAVGLTVPASASAADLAAALIARAHQRAGVLIVAVDQLEEIFTLGAPADERERFAEALVAAADGSAGAVRVLLCLRDDFLARAEALGPLRGRLASALTVLVTPRPAELRRIVLEPAHRAGYRFEDEAVVDEMVAAIADRPGGLALLSFAALAWWERRDRDRHELPTAAYRRLGGVAGALASHAEALYAGMPARAQRAAREVLRHLVTAEGTRAALPTADLVELAGPGGDEALAALVAGRLLVARDDVDGDVVELTHEALIDAWPLIRRIREEDAADAGLRDDLRAAARGWSQRGRRDDELWRGRALVELDRHRARAGVRLTLVEETFADASRALGRRTRRRRRALVIGAIAAATAAAIALGLAERSARRSEARAQVLAGQARRGESDAELRLAGMWAAEGRRESAHGSPLRALAYLAPAYGRIDGPGIRFALARAMTSIDDQRAMLRAHHAPVDHIEWSADGRLLATGDEEEAARLWRFDRGQVEPVADLGEKAGVFIGFSADGKRFAMGDENGVAIRDLASRAQLAHIVDERGVKGELGGHLTGDGRSLLLYRADGLITRYGLDGAVLERVKTGVKFDFLEASWTGDRAVFTGVGGGLHMVDLARGAVRELLPASMPLGVVDIDARGSVMIAVGTDGNTYVFDGATGARRHVLASHPGRHGAAVSRDGRWIATGGAERAAKLFDATSGRLVATLSEHRGPISVLAFDPTSQLLATAAGDGAVRIYNTRGAMLAAYEGHAADVVSLAWSPDGKWLASGGADGVVVLWPGRAPQTRELAGGAGELMDLDVCGHLLAMAHERELALYDLVAGKLTRRIAIDEAVDGVICSVRAGRIAVGTASGMRLFSLDGTEVAHVKGKAAVDRLAFSRDGRRMATLGYDGIVRLWDPASGEAIRAITGDPGAAAHPSALDFSGDGAVLYIGDSTGQVSTWDTGGAGERRRARLHQTEILSLRLSPDGTRLATGAADRSLSISRASDLTPVRTIDEHASYITSIDWSGDGALLLTGSQDSTAFVWEVDTGALVGEIRPGQGAVASALFDGDRIIAGSWGGRVMSFPAALERRSPAAIRQLLECRLPYRLAKNGRLERATPGEGCAQNGAPMARPAGLNAPSAVQPR